jgi:hypothetical protein
MKATISLVMHYVCVQARFATRVLMSSYVREYKVRLILVQQLGNLAFQHNSVVIVHKYFNNVRFRERVHTLRNVPVFVDIGPVCAGLQVKP